MTIADQLRDLADRADKHQRPITAAEIITRASSRQSHGIGSFVTPSELDDRRRFPDRSPVPLAKEDITMIGLEPPAPTDSRRRPNRALVAVLLAAAAVVTVVVVAIRNDDDSTPADEPPPTVTVPPRALFGTPDEQFAAGPYAVNVIEGTPTPRIVVTLGSGWTNTTDEWSVGKEGVGFVTFSRPDRVFTDACLSINGFHPGPVTTLDGLVTALSEQGGWAEVNTPSDITVDGYAGRAFQRTAPTDFTGCSTSFAPFRSWENDDPNGLGWSYYERGEIETLWVLDLDGTVVIVNTRMLPDHRATAVAELAAVLDSIRIDGGTDDSRVPGSDPDSEASNPLEAVTENLVNGADDAMFRVTADEPSYWRVTTLAEFDGRTFQLPTRDLTPFEQPATSDPGDRTIRQQVQIQALSGRLVPAAATPAQIEPATDIHFDPESETLMKGSDLTPGDQFTVVSEAHDVTLDEMRSTTTDNPPRSLYLALPDNVDDTVYDLAAGATASAPTDADKMIALQNWFRSEFTYGVTAPSDKSRDAIATFLTTRRGNCEPFATTFAVMARTLGIPSRVAVGFTTGELDAGGAYTVFGRHAHAWPEVWFDGIGWVPFEPTPHHSIPGAEDSTETNATAQSLD